MLHVFAIVYIDLEHTGMFFSARIIDEADQHIICPVFIVCFCVSVKSVSAIPKCRRIVRRGLLF